jgi:hypothetical protein
MSLGDQIALVTVVAAFTPMAVYFLARVGAAIIISIYGEQQ